MIYFLFQPRSQANIITEIKLCDDFRLCERAKGDYRFQPWEIQTDKEHDVDEKINKALLSEAYTTLFDYYWISDV